MLHNTAVSLHKRSCNQSHDREEFGASSLRQLHIAGFTARIYRTTGDRYSSISPGCRALSPGASHPGGQLDASHTKTNNPCTTSSWTLADGSRRDLTGKHRRRPPLIVQVWRCALLLGDLVLAHPELVEGKTVVELGAGCGVAGIAAARHARRVLLTDLPSLVAACRVGPPLIC